MPIQIKRSTTTAHTPSGLAEGELAVCIPDAKLWVGPGTGTLLVAPSTFTGYPVTAAQGGTGLTSISLGSMLVGGNTNTWQQVSGNATTTQKFLAQTGTGTTPGVPTWVDLAGTYQTVGAGATTQIIYNSGGTLTGSSNFTWSSNKLYVNGQVGIGVTASYPLDISISTLTRGINVAQAATTGTNYGVYSSAAGSGATSNYGVYGTASGATNNYGGYFIGSTAGLWASGAGSSTHLAMQTSGRVNITDASNDIVLLSITNQANVSANLTEWQDSGGAAHAWMDFAYNFYANSFHGSGAALTSLNGTQITSGTVGASYIANLDAGKITTGTMATARLGSGSANNTVFLRGDQTWAAPDLSAYLTIASASSTYLTQTNAASTYLTQTNAASTYLTQTNAASTYQTTAGMSSYLTTASASSTYLTQTNAASTYQTIAGMSSYLSTSTAASTYLSTSTSLFGFPRVYTFGLAIGGAATTGTNKTNAIMVERAGVITKAYIYAKTGPTGAALICDIKKNGTSIWNATPANRIQIAAGGTSNTQTAFDTTAIAEGDVLTIDIAQIGSTVAGQDITVQLLTLLRNS